MKESNTKSNVKNTKGKSRTAPPPPPSAPLGRHIIDGVGVFCKKCNSTKSRSGFLGLVGKRYCDNEDCSNRKPCK